MNLGLIRIPFGTNFRELVTESHKLWVMENEIDFVGHA